METFESSKYNVRSLLQNDREEKDRDKNYFIPPSQRKYAWNIDEVKKLIDNIYSTYINKDTESFDPYFIGGIVLSLESMMGKERSKKSLEVIDGQQRLTTIVLVLAYVVQSLDFQDREFKEKKDIALHLVNDIKKLLIKNIFNTNTMKMEKQCILERSDKMAKNFEIAVDCLINTKIYDANTIMDNFVDFNDDSEKLIEIINAIKTIIDNYNNEDLVGFTIQLLNFTWLVVTKTISIETGFLIFEKLNTTGRPLEAQDLLKSFLFQITDDKEYDALQDKWELLLDKIKEITPGKSKILPSEFLELYLTVNGMSIKETNKKNKREWIFEKYKDLQLNTYTESDKLLDDLVSLAEEYKKLKNSNYGKYIESINFGLGYLIVLSFYKKYPLEYILYEKEILSLVIRIGITFLIIGESSSISAHLPVLCQTIINNGSKIEETLKIVNDLINKLIKNKEEKIENTVSSTGIFRRKAQSTLLLEIIEYHISKKRISNAHLFQLMPTKFNEACNFEGIIDETCSKYANFIGNLVLTEKKIQDKTIHCFKDRYNCIKDSDIEISNLTNSYLIEDKIIKKEIVDIKDWGKKAILERSLMISELVKLLFIDNKIDKDFFS